MMVHSNNGHSHHGHLHTGHSHSHSSADLDILRALTSSNGIANAKRQYGKPQPTAYRSTLQTRRPQLDPLILETAASSGPHVTRMHFLHEYYPHPEDESSPFSRPSQVYSNSRRRSPYASCDIGPEDEDEQSEDGPTPSTSRLSDPSTAGKHEEAANQRSRALERMMQSRQAPRKERLERERIEKAQLATTSPIPEEQEESEEISKIDGTVDSSIPMHENLKDAHPPTVLPQPPQPLKKRERRRRPSLLHPDPIELPKLLKASRPPPSTFSSSYTQQPKSKRSASPHPALRIQCMARTRVPTPHGECFLHLYQNNVDDKEHLAFVFDREQLEDPAEEHEDKVHGSIRSRSLDAVWRAGETDMERIVRGAYVGRLSSSTAYVSEPPTNAPDNAASSERDPALVRVHSECFTGETIGSQRCDCGEQLDEAFRLISTSATGRGIIVYLRQEGRGIGLLEKIRAYNLQDLGHDTVTANLLLGHGADQRTYGIAGEILRDLGVEEVRLLTNNPDKMQNLEREHISVKERVPMVPRGWMSVAKADPVLPGGKAKKGRARKGNKQMQALTSATDESIYSVAASDVSEGEAGSYEFPSRPGSVNAADETYSSSDDESDEEAAEEARADYLISSNRAGVGMIGAGMTHSTELERYLRTKIERMGHMLVSPERPPSTPEPLKRRKNRKVKQVDYGKEGRAGDGGSASRNLVKGKSANEDQGALEEGAGQTMHESTASLHTDPESIHCEAGDEGCSGCEREEAH